MRRLIAIALLMTCGNLLHAQILSPILQVAPATTWTVVQVVQNDACAVPASTCNVTYTATAGNLVIGLLYSTSLRSISSLSGGGTWVHPAGCAVSNATAAAGVDQAYTLSATGGATTTTFTLSASDSTFFVPEIVEIHRSSGTATFDACGTANLTSNCTACTGPTLTLHNSPEFIMVAAAVENTGPTFNSPYVVDGGAVSFAGYWNTATTGAAVVVNQTPTGQMAISSMALY